MNKKRTIGIVLLLIIILIFYGCVNQSNLVGEAKNGLGKGMGGFGKVKSQCNDGLDNDGDGYCDFNTKRCKDGAVPGDINCESKEDNNESPLCTPSQEICDGKDNDCDYEIDESLPISCSSSTDCGVNGWIGQQYCGSDGNVHREWVEYTCNNGGTCSSTCSSQTEERLFETCTMGCINGICTITQLNLTPTPEPGDYAESLIVDNRMRTYLLHIPTGYDPEQEYPLVLVFHGGLGTGEKIASGTRFSYYADKERFIVAYPDGIGRSWNDGRGTTEAEMQGIDDINFVNLLLNHLKNKLSINDEKIYATGASNGGMMTLRLGCELPNTFTAIAPVIANLPEPLNGTCNPQAIPILMINGREDPLVPYEGGECCGDPEGFLGQGGRVISLEDTVDIFAEANQCTDKTSEYLPIIINDGTEVEKRSYAQCSSNKEVVSYLVHGMGHSWPPNPPQLEASGNTSKNIAATKVIWEFFESRPIS